MTLDPEIESFQEQVSELGDELVYDDESITPQDAFFICDLLEEYYNAKAEEEFGSVKSVEYAWDIAREIAEHVDTNDDLDWINAYFIISGAGDSIRRDMAEFDDDLSWDSSPPVEHLDGFSGDSETSHSISNAVSEISELAELYVDLESESEGPMDKCSSLSMVFSHLGTRYAHEFPDDMLESAVGMQMTETFVSWEKDESINKTEMLYGIRLVEKWCGLRARREHEMLCIGTELENS